MNNSKVSIGSEIDFHIIRNGVKIHEHKNLHNTLAQSLLTSGYRLNLDSVLTGASGSQFSTYSTRIKYATALTSTFQQVGVNISRTSGVDPLPLGGGFAVWPGNIFAGYVVSSNTSAGAATMSTSVNVAPTTGLTFYNFGVTYTGNDQFISGITAFNATTYSNGVSSKSLTTSQAFPLVTVPYTLRRIGLFSTQVGSQVANYDLPSDIPLLAGDQVVVAAVTMRMTYAAYAPVTFSVCPITGITTTGKIQKLLPASADFATPQSTPNRIYLVTTPNAVTLANMLAHGAAIPLSSTITAAATITATGTATAAAGSNNMTNTFQGSATLAGTTADVKQIYLGNATQLYSVIEFDTPQTLTAGKILTILSSTTVMPDLPTT